MNYKFQNHTLRLPKSIATPSKNCSPVSRAPRDPIRCDGTSAVKAADTEFVIDDWQGPTAAIISCCCRERWGLLWLQAWSGTHLHNRIYTLSALPAIFAEALARSLVPTTCQVDRSQQALEHLISLCSDTTYLRADLALGLCEPVDRFSNNEGQPKPTFDNWRSGLSQQKFWDHYLSASRSTTLMS